jgi:integrase
MATVNAVVYDQFKRDDGTCHVQIKIFHKDVRRFIETNHYVTVRQLDDKLKIKDKHILKSLEETLTNYRQTIGDLAPKLDFFTCDDLKAYLINKDKEVDFIDFCSQHIESLRKAKRNGTADNHRAIRNSLIDYFNKKIVSIVEINSGMLFAYEKWLQTDRTMTRTNQLGNEVTTTEKGMQAGGIYSHMRDLRTLFNEARRIYNNEDIGVIKIKHYPFKVYKIGAPPKTKKRNIPAEQIIKLKNSLLKPESRAELARDLFMLSFYMCGMNAVDFYNLNSYDPESTRLEYNRSKTTGLRDDDAFISVKIVPEARPLLEKYIGKLQNRYSTYNGLDTALSKGMHQLRKIAGVADITFYWARHTFATIARNKCHMDKDSIAEALNHVDGDHKTTDIYIEKDWSIVDKVQAAVIKFFRELNKPKPAKPQTKKLNELVDPIEYRKTMRLVTA